MVEPEEPSAPEGDTPPARSSDQPAAAPAVTPALAPTLPFAFDAADTGGEFGPGAELGRYQIRRVVGAGGMGLVLSAYDDELNRLVAIKVLARDQGEARTRLVREAQAMAKLSHPNVVTVYEVLKLHDRTGIVMELVDGQDLARWRGAARRTWREIVDAYVQAARGLAAAHRAGLVHRDFKPSNALIDRDGVVRVTDFGLVRTTETDAPPAGADGADRPPADVALTRTGTVLGTPAYMAPEQHAGEPVDARTDQWALACSLYSALYDQRPFPGETQAELAAAVLAGTPRAEPADPHVPRRIRAAIRKALARRPEDRFATMDELIAALTPPRRAWQAAVAGVVAISAAVAVVAVTRGDDAATCDGLDAPAMATWNPTRAEALRARFASTGPSFATEVATRAIAGLDDYRTRWIGARVEACNRGRQGVDSHELLDQRMRCLDHRLVELDAVIGGLIEANPKTMRGAVDAVDRLHPIADCDDPKDTVPRPADPAARAQIERAETTLARAFALAELGQFADAIPLAREAADVGDRTGWPPLAARALVQLGRATNREGDTAASLELLDRAATAAALAQDDPVLAEALVARFYVLGDALGKPAEALAGKQFVELSLARAGQPPRVRALWLHNLAIIYLDQDRFDEALAAETEAVAILRRIVPAGHVLLTDSLETEGNIQTYRKQFDQAAALLDEVLASAIATRGADHPKVASVLGNIGVLEAERGDMPGAIARWERSLAIRRAAGTPPDWSAVYNLGLAKYELGRWRASVDDLAAGLVTAESSAPGDTQPVSYTATQLGAVYLWLGDLDRAQPLLERAVTAAKASGSPGLVDAIGFTALLALERGDPAAARARIAEVPADAAAKGATLAYAAAELERAERGCKAALPGYQHTIDLVTGESAYDLMTMATFGLGECQLELGHAADAVTTLEARLAWLDKVAAEPVALARGRFALARALVAAGGDRARARALAEDARTAFATLGAPGARRAAAVAAWLSHQPR